MDLIPKDLVAGQTSYNPAWVYSFTQSALIRDGRLLYLFPADPQPHLAALAQSDYGLRTLRYLSGEVQERSSRQYHTPQTPMGLVMYRVPLEPGDTRELVFKMPIAPLVADSEEARLVEAADCGEQLHGTVATWDELADSLADVPAGSEVAIVVQRGDARVTTVLPVANATYPVLDTDGQPTGETRTRSFIGIRPDASASRR